jgi:thioredoxin-related protein
VAKPVVDRLEEELEGRAEVLRVNAFSRLGGSLAGRYGVRGVPTLLVFDGNGQVVYAQTGLPDRQAIDTAVAGVLAQ